MEMATGLYALMGTGAAAGAGSAGSWLAGTTAANAAGTTVFSGAGAGAGSSVLSIAQGALTAGSILASLAGGVMGNSEAKLQATATELQARDEALRIKREELQKIGAARVAFGASGVSLASGDPIEADLRQQSQFETALTRNSGRVAASQIRLRGRAGLVEAAAKAMGTGANYAIDLRTRG